MLKKGYRRIAFGNGEVTARTLQQTFYENTRLRTNNDPPSAQIFPDKDNAQNLI